MNEKWKDKSRVKRDFKMFWFEEEEEEKRSTN